MRSSRLILGAAAASLGLTLGQASGGLASEGPMSFTPIAGSAYGEQQSPAWTEPFVVPDGFTQTLVKDESTFDVYPGADDLTDMNTVNETGKHAGRYLYRTHEVGSRGSLSVVDLTTGDAEVLVQEAGYRRLDGLRWTPWGTLLFAEETKGGRLFEAFLDPRDPSELLRVEVRPELGAMRHEGIGTDQQGNVYVIDELNGGSLYRFVPTTRGDLSDGQLYALRLTGLADDEQEYDAEADLAGTPDLAERTGSYEWVPLDMATAVVDAEQAANDVHATGFGRPEDVELIGNVLYVATTTEDRVVAIDLKAEVLTSFVEAGRNVPEENEDAGVTGFNGPDNLASGPGGQLWVVEDNTPSDIWVAGRDRDGDGAAEDVELFASLKDPEAEGSGIYFGTDPRTLYVNVQHPTKSQADGTWSITGT